ncbi:MAG: hypothetical protein DHS80DRAFT_22203 [Piptocephalis tieghemiana]|nr:MAG: hypothetical protein DHS80DRAFT_22203 [Piptocephalis tieghemiana]
MKLLAATLCSLLTISSGMMTHVQAAEAAQGAAPAPATAPAAAPAAAPPQDPQAVILQNCLNRCDVNNVNCKAACVKVPSPSGVHVDRTTNCMKSCDPSNSQAYNACQLSCIDTNFVSGSGSVSIPGGKTTTSSSAGEKTDTAPNGTNAASPSNAGTKTSTGTMEGVRRADLAMGVMVATATWLIL